MPWNTFVPPTSPDVDNIYLPGNYSTNNTPVTVDDTVGGVSIIAADNTKKLRFANISVEAKPHSVTGKQIVVFIGVGITPSPTNYSFKWLSGYEAKDLEINGQEITAICETGQTINLNIQLADPVTYP